jgi:uridylate kinase
MTSDNQKIIVISLGGSLIVPDDINTVFLQEFKACIEKKVQEGFRFLIIAGGGKLSRSYNTALEQVRTVDNEALDWLGIYATHLNAHLVHMMFEPDLVHGELITAPDMLTDVTAPIIVGGGWKPGASSDHAMIAYAHACGATTAINLSNISHVYDMDPRENPQAQKFEKLSWQQYRSFIPTDWKPGLSTPFDPIAAQKADEYGISVAIMNDDLENLEAYIDGKSFSGTHIS